MSDLVERVRQVLPSVRDDLEDLVRIQSVWADPARRDQVHRSAQATADLLSQAGFGDVQIVSEGGAPAVIARHAAPPGAPTVLLYAHHDVQPEGDPDQWTSPPFEPTERDGRLYGRGSADDKAGIATHLAAFRAHGGKPPVGVTVFVEGEEESGSPSLGRLLTAHRDALAADVIVIADSDNWSTDVPALTVSLRGLADCVVEVATLDHGLHSGLWGGVVPDALSVLVRLLASLHDDDGNVAVAGLHESMATAVDYPDERVRDESGLLDGVTEIGSGSVPQRMWAKPAITVIGLDTTSIAASSNTLIPRARAKVSMRVAPGGDAAAHLAALRTHLEQHAPWGAHVIVTPGDIGQPYAIDVSGPVYDAARAAFRHAWGTEPVEMGMGGSIPFIAEFAAAFPNAAILVTGVEDPATQAHSVNESLHLGVLERAATAEALLLACEYPTSIAISRDGSTLYVTNNVSPYTVTVIAVATPPITHPNWSETLVAQILVGVINDAGGWVELGGKIIRVPPRQPVEAILAALPSQLAQRLAPLLKAPAQGAKPEAFAAPVAVASGRRVSGDARLSSTASRALDRQVAA